MLAQSVSGLIYANDKMVRVAGSQYCGTHSRTAKGVEYYGPLAVTKRGRQFLISCFGVRRDRPLKLSIEVTLQVLGQSGVNPSLIAGHGA